MKDTVTKNKIPFLVNLLLQKLTSRQVKRIDEMLEEVGEYGEVHIIVQNGELTD